MRTILLTILFFASATGLFAQNADQGPTVNHRLDYNPTKEGPRGLS